MTTYLKRKDRKTGKISCVCDYSAREVAEKALRYLEGKDENAEYDFFLDDKYEN